jgi:hypothetical protein
VGRLRIARRAFEVDISLVKSKKGPTGIWLRIARSMNKSRIAVITGDDLKKEKDETEKWPKDMEFQLRTLNNEAIEVLRESK